MNSNYKIYLICHFNGKPLDFVLPALTPTQFSELEETAGTCFKIYDKRGASILLSSRTGKTCRVNIEEACLDDANISFTVIIDEAAQTAFLRAFTDKEHNASFPLPFDFIQSTQTTCPSDH